MMNVASVFLLFEAVFMTFVLTNGADELYDSIYPGQVNLGLLAPVRRRLSNSCSDLDEDVTRSVMSGVWAINQVNSRKEARELNLGLHVYDTCDNEKAVKRLMLDLSLHRCRGDSRPPIAGIIALGDAHSILIPSTVISAFAVPMITTSFVGSSWFPRLYSTPMIFSTSPSPNLLARALIELAHFSNWTRIAVIAGDRANQSRDVFNDMASKEKIEVYPFKQDIINSSVQAITIFESSEEHAIEILNTFKNTPEIPVIVISSVRRDVKLLKGKIGYEGLSLIVVSPENLTIPSFEEFWREELSRGNSSEHPFMRELTKSNDTDVYDRLMNASTDVSPVVKAVWIFAEALKFIQNRACNRFNDCMSLIKQTLNGDISQQLRTSNFTINDVFEERNVSLGFDHVQKLLGGRIFFHLLRKNVCEQFGWYGDDSVTNLPVLNITSVDYLVPPTRSSKTKGPRSSSLLSSPVREVTSANATWQNHTNLSTESNDVYNVPTTGGSYNLAAWVSRPWCLAVIVLSTVGILSCIYITSFLLMKSCEGALKKRNQPLLFLTIVAMSLALVSAISYVFRPSALLCRICRVCHNLSLTFLSGSLLLQGMHLRSQELLGLGGSVSRLNQMITLGFILGVQIAIETQQWLFRKSDFQYVNSLPLCNATTFEFATSQIYISYLVLMGVIVAYSSRNVPYNHREGQCLWLTQVSFLIAFAAKFVLYCVLDVADVRDLTRSVGLIVLSYIVLAGIYIPYLYDVHSQGGLPHKPLSYAESMSTVFTMFKQDGDSVSGESTTSRGRKGAKTLERTDGMVEMTHNPLYDDFRSVYA